MSSIDPAVLQNADEWSARFDAAKPFRHVAIPDFLPKALCERLLADFPDFEARHALNEMGEVGGKAVRMDVRDISAAYRELDRVIQTDEFLARVSRVTGIPGLLYDPDYIGGGTHENRDGQSLDAHVDFNYHPRTRWHRRLNLIVYLNPAWESSWGGELELHSNPWDGDGNRTVSIAPLFNTCVIFETTETSWHGFSQIEMPLDKKHLSRKSFAIYLYTRERPPEQTAPPHATIYVPESLPADWKAGRELSDEDMHELHTRFTRMRTQLRYLYDREKQFGAQMDARDYALDEARRAQRLNLQGYATQPHGVRGVWPDDWAGAEVTTSFVPTRAAKELILELWSPPQLEAHQELRIEIGGSSFTQVLRPGLRTPVPLALRMRAGEEVRLAIRSSHTWTPAAAGESGDQRALAFKILSAELRH
ncbi:MAG: 2OG-Fe(II) oxygenase [Dokdonella sp.]